MTTLYRMTKFGSKLGEIMGKIRLSLHFIQVINLEKPNSKQNTIVIAIASIRDSYENIDRFLEGGLGHDLEALKRLKWRGKALKLFVNGDYEFLCKLYGLSGPQGTYPCLWCLMPSRTLRVANVDNCHHRSLDFLYAHYCIIKTAVYSV